MTKIYIVVDKKGNPQKRGHARKCAWTSPRYLNYHFGKRNWGNTTEFRGKDLDVITLDTTTGKSTKTSIPAFLNTLNDPAQVRVEIHSKLGFDVDLVGLESLVKGKLLPEYEYLEAKKLLQSQGINC